MHPSASLKPLALAALLAAAGSAHAALTVYTSQASFLAALSAPGTDTFNDLDLSVDPGDPLARSAGAYSYSVASAGGAAGLVTVGTVADKWLSTFESFASLQFSGLAPSVRAFGGYFFATGEAGNVAVEQTVTVSAFGVGESVTHVLASATSASFVGFVSTGPLSMVEASVTGGGDATYFATANDITIGGTVSAVPEPGSWAIMMSGVGLLAVTWRRRRSGQAG